MLVKLALGEDLLELLWLFEASIKNSSGKFIKSWKIVEILQSSFQTSQNELRKIKFKLTINYVF